MAPATNTVKLMSNEVGLRLLYYGMCFFFEEKDLIFDPQCADHRQLDASALSHRQRRGRGLLPVRPALLGHRSGRGHHQRGRRIRHRHHGSVTLTHTLLDAEHAPQLVSMCLIHYVGFQTMRAFVSGWLIWDYYLIMNIKL